MKATEILRMLLELLGEVGCRVPGEGKVFIDLNKLRGEVEARLETEAVRESLEGVE